MTRQQCTPQLTSSHISTDRWTLPAQPPELLDVHFRPALGLALPTEWARTDRQSMRCAHRISCMRAGLWAALRCIEPKLFTVMATKNQFHEILWFEHALGVGACTSSELILSSRPLASFIFFSAVVSACRVPRPILSGVNQV